MSRTQGVGYYTPKGHSKKVGARTDWDEVDFLGGAGTPAKGEVIYCICGKNRESAAKNKKDWVECGRWSQLLCYKIATAAAAQDEVRFFCFFSVMETIAKVSDLVNGSHQHQDSLKALSEEIKELKKNAKLIRVEVATMKKHMIDLERDNESKDKNIGELYAIVDNQGRKLEVNPKVEVNETGEGDSERVEEKGEKRSSGSDSTIEDVSWSASRKREKGVTEVVVREWEGRS